MQAQLPGYFAFHCAILAADPVGSPPGAFVVTGLGEETDLDKLRQENKERAEVCRTLRMLRACKQPWQHQRVHQKVKKHKLVEKKAHAAKKGAGKGKGEGKGKAAAETSEDGLEDGPCPIH